MKLEQLGDKVVSVVNADDPVDKAIRHMWRMNIRHLPVVRRNVPVGMVSERDVLFHVCWLDHVESSLAGENGRPASGASRIDQIMSSPAVVLSPDDPIEKAGRLMLNKRISAVPLAVNNAVVGIVTETDFLRCYLDDNCGIPSAQSRESKVPEHMSTNVFSVKPSDTMLAAIRLMRDNQVRHLAVVQDERLIGILSDRDVLRGTRRDEGDHAFSASELKVSNEIEVRGVMSTKLEVLAPSATLAQAAKKMVENKIGALPVLESQKQVGIITETDLLRALVADGDE